MHARTFKLSAIGAAVGLVLAAAAVTPASAAPAAEQTTITSSCSAFNGRTVTGSTASFSGVGLRGGEVITVTVSQPRAEDRIFLTALPGLNMFFYDAPATTGLRWVVPGDGLYNLQWKLTTTGTPLSSVDWKFSATCSSTSVAPAPSPSPSSPTKPGKGKGGKG